MDFIEVRDVTSSDVATTKIGMCKQGDNEFKCVEKVYDENYFDDVVAIVERFSDKISELGPEIFAVDKVKRAVYMEYIDCPTLEEYLSKLSVSKSEDRAKLSSVFCAINTFMDRMRRFGLCHGDLHTENLMVCMNGIRMIDIDNLTLTEEQGWCSDDNLLGETMIMALVKDLKEEMQKAKEDAYRTFKTKVESTLRIIEDIGFNQQIEDSMRKRTARF